MFHTAKVAAAGLIAATALVAGSTSPATAAEVRVPSTVTIDGYHVNPDVTKVTFRGTVTSEKAFCDKGRKITLKQVDDGVVAGRTTSDDTGAWKVRFGAQEVNPGVFKAIMARKVVERDGRTYVCTADTDRYDASGA